jgi:hypothetical protein
LGDCWYISVFILLPVDCNHPVKTLWHSIHYIFKH